MSDYIFNSKLPCGNNSYAVVIRVTTMEDAVIINKNSLERGMFNTSYYKVYESFESVDKQKGTTEYFYSPKMIREMLILTRIIIIPLDEFGVVKENNYVFKMMFY